MRLKLLLILMITALLLTACGKKGPVRPLPEPPAEAQKPLTEGSEKN